MVRRVLLVAAMVVGAMTMGTQAAGGDEIPKGNPRIATGSWAEALKAHPRLAGSRDFLRALAKAKAGGYMVARQLQTNDVLAAGVVNAVEGIPQAEADAHIKAAMKDVNAGVTNVHQETWIALSNAAVTYDMFYDQITPADRAKMIAWFNGHLAKFTIDENAFHNSTLSKINCYLRIAYGTWGDNPRAKDFRDYAIVKLYEGKIVPVLKTFGAGGGFTEGGWYTRGSMWHLVQALEMARRFEKYDGFALAPNFFYQRMAYELYQPYPGLWIQGAEQYPLEGDGSNVYGGHNEYPREMRTVLAQYFRGSELAGFIAAKDRRPSNPESAFIDFLYKEPVEAARPMTEAPLAHLAEGIGKVYARSDWRDDATWLRFECGAYWANHQHLEVGNFEIFRYEPLATESGEYTDYDDSHAINWLTRTVAHNCILVYQPGEQWRGMRDGGKIKPANDGGQNIMWGYVADTVNQWMAGKNGYSRGQIVAYDDEDEYMYVAGNCTKAYSPEKLSLWVRQIVFLRPGTFVIFDRVVAKRADYPKAWLLHCKNEPEIRGSRVAIKNGRGELFVETLLPLGAKISKVKGYTYPAFAGGESFPAKASDLTPAANLWRMEVSPAKPAEEDLFLHVLSTDGLHEAKLTQEGNKVSVQIGPVTVNFIGKCGGEIVAGGKKTPLAEKVEKGDWE